VEGTDPVDTVTGLFVYSAKRNGDRLVRLGIATAVLLTVLGFAPVPAWAVETDSATFRIQDYIPVKFTDFGWKLDGGCAVNRRQTTDSRRVFESAAEYDDLVIPSDSGGNAIAFENLIRYRYLTRQGTLILEFGPGGGGYRTAEDTVKSAQDAVGAVTETSRTSKVRSTQVSIPFKGETRRYLVGDVFLSANGDFEYSYDQTTDEKEHSTNQYDDADSLGRISISISERLEKSRGIVRRIDFTGEIRLGYGRVYEGRHAATALQLVAELRNRGLLQREPTRNEMLSLSVSVHKFREGHGPDTRDYREENVRMILDWLVRQGILDEGATVAHARVEDVLDYYSAEDRPFGWQVQVGFGGHDQYYNRQSDKVITTRKLRQVSEPYFRERFDTLELTTTRSVTSGRDRNFAPKDHLILKCDYSRPLSLAWQFDLGLEAISYLEPRGPSDGFVIRDGASYSYLDDRYDLYTSARLAFLCDPRTSLGLTVEWTTTSFVYRDHRFRNLPDSSSIAEVIRSYRYRRSDLVATLEAAYRVSHNTTIVAEWAFTNRNYVYDYDYVPFDSRYEWTAANFSAGITHWLF
jgi:hypothetical protein